MSNLRTLVSEILDLATKVTFSSRLDERGNPTGMHVEFCNGLVVSIQWHSGAYSSVGRRYENEPIKCPTYETGAWFTTIERETDYGPTTAWFSPEHGRTWEGWDDGDSVQPYQSLEQVIALAHQCATFGESC